MTKLIIVISVLLILCCIIYYTAYKTSFSTNLILDSYLLPPDILNKFQDYKLNDSKAQNVEILKWDESTKTLEYHDVRRKMVYTLRLKEDGFHRIKSAKW